jgi:cytochrome c
VKTGEQGEARIMAIRRRMILSGLTLAALAGAPAHGEQAAAAATTSGIVTPASAAGTASPRRGQLLFIAQCRACHAAEAVSDPLKIGPHLNQLLGRKAGTVADYRYSDALKKSELTWTREQLDLWLQKPTGVVPGTTMTFAGLPEAADRAALIAYLAQDASAH